MELHSKTKSKSLNILFILRLIEHLSWHRFKFLHMPFRLLMPWNLISAKSPTFHWKLILFISLKVAGKRDPEQEQLAQEWIDTIVGEKFQDKFENSLRSGILLCKLMNKLQPGIIPKINLSGGDYKMMDNLSQFQIAAKHYGVPELDVFEANDLWEFKNICGVTKTIFAVGRAVSFNFKLNLIHCLK